MQYESLGGSSAIANSKSNESTTLIVGDKCRAARSIYLPARVV